MACNRLCRWNPLGVAPTSNPHLGSRAVRTQGNVYAPGILAELMTAAISRLDFSQARSGNRRMHQPRLLCLPGSRGRVTLPSR